MSKFVLFGILVLTMLFVTAGVSAKTLIAGKIYNADFSGTIAGVDVIVKCVHGTTNTLSTTSLSDGSYSVIYNETGDFACNNGDFLSVSATKGELSGYKEGEIHDDAFADWDLAVVNVPLVPEFGVIIGGLTILSAIGVFFMVRRR
ncbi:MAG: hypothetical protein AABW51_05415 [Nanoarchaeota archaeon]